VQDLVNGPMLSTQINPIIDGNFQALSANGIVATTNNIPVTQSDANGVKTYLSARRSFMTGELAKVTAPFEISNNAGQNFAVTNQAGLTLLGKAPVEVAFIRLNGATTNANVTWTSVTNWSLSIALLPHVSTNTATLRAYDRLNQALATNIYQKSITVTNK
jgi:hypothetical protein